ncbi:hypothetical protein J6590_038045 [Homalodisca vitripennis]|nr:hypothetical protein J6590_038045 [Homalodisca vitripennis]
MIYVRSVKKVLIRTTIKRLDYRKKGLRLAIREKYGTERSAQLESPELRPRSSEEILTLGGDKNDKDGTEKVNQKRGVNNYLAPIDRDHFTRHRIHIGLCPTRLHYTLSVAGEKAYKDTIWIKIVGNGL